MKTKFYILLVDYVHSFNEHVCSGISACYNTGYTDGTGFSSLELIHHHH